MGLVRQKVRVRCCLPEGLHREAREVIGYGVLHARDVGYANVVLSLCCEKEESTHEYH